MKFRFTASFDTFCTLDVEAESLEAAQKIADDSDGGDWKTCDHGDWHIEYANTMQFDEATQTWRYVET